MTLLYCLPLIVLALIKDSRIRVLPCCSRDYLLAGSEENRGRRVSLAVGAW